MTAEPTSSSRMNSGPLVNPKGALVAVACFLAISFASAQAVSFSLPFAFFKLSLALIHFIGIGLATSLILKLRRPRHLAGAWYALIGQVAGLAYVYARSLLCQLAGIPGLSSLEVHLAEGIIACWLLTRPGLALPRPTKGWRSPLAETSCHLIWLSWLFAIASQKLGLLYTPSSDPDIHAFYTRILLDRGQFFYDLQPISDAWMIYPSGFSAMGLALARITGFHPVQLVNLGAYLQVALFAGFAFSFLARGLRRPAALVALALCFFSVCYLCLNPIYLAGRSHLEGTPRLAHTALLFFPLLFNAINAMPIVQRPGILLLPLTSVLVGMCLNPTHAPASLLMGALSLLPLFATRARRRQLARRRPGAWIALILICAGIGTAVLTQDPFYRSLAQQQLDLWPELEAAEDLTGSALELHLKPGDLMARLAASGGRWFFPPPDENASARPLAQATILVLFLLFLCWRLFGKRRRARFALRHHHLLVFGLCAVGFIAIHAIWLECVPMIAKPNVLQSVLLIRYTQAVQDQATLAFFTLLVCIPIVLTLAFVDPLEGDVRGSSLARISLPLLLLCAGILASTPSLYALARENWREFNLELNKSPFGTIEMADVAFLREIAQMIPEGERVMLPGRLRRTGIEHWIFSTGIGRALPLFTDTRTSFFLGLDGRAFTPAAYIRHIREGVDREWLHSLGVVWLIENGNFHPKSLRRHWRLVAGSAQGNLWHLRDIDDPAAVR